MRLRHLQIEPHFSPAAGCGALPARLPLPSSTPSLALIIARLLRNTLFPLPSQQCARQCLLNAILSGYPPESEAT